MKKRITRRSFVSVMAAVAVAPHKVEGTSRPAEQARNSIQTDKHDVGEMLRFSSPYFPMLLGNGREHALVGYSGAMGACSGHEYWSYGLTPTGWFRPDVSRRPASGVLNLLQCGYIVRRGIYADSIDRAEQVFNPRSGVLITDCHLADSEVRVKTFLTRDSLLIHRFTVTPRAGSMAMQFFIRTPSPEGPLRVLTGLGISSPPGKEESQIMTFEIVGQGLPVTPGQVLSDHPKAKKVICYNRLPGIEVPLTERSEFTFVVQCDRWEGPHTPAVKDFSQDVFDFSQVFNTHAAEWRKFDSRSRVHIARDAIDTAYRISLYTIRSHQNPTMGGITVGGYPGMWTNGINSFDISYSLMALLGANRIREAELIVQFWDRILPNLRKRAREAGLPGIACDQSISPWGESPRKSRNQILEEKHFITANITLHVLQLFKYTGQLGILKKHWDCLVEPVKFLLGACVREYPDHAEIIRSSGPDGKERVNGKLVYYPNPTRTLLATIEAVRAVIETSELLGRKTDARWKDLLGKLERGINANRFNCVVRAYRDPQAPPWADSAYVGLFNVPTDEKTLTAETEYYMSPEGLLRWPDQGERVIPWLHLDLSAAMSRRGLPGAARMLETASRYKTNLEAFPEGVRPDGIYTKTWYPTVHGAFVLAVNLLLLCRRDDAVDLFGGVPMDWGDARFRSLRIPPGLVVSASRTRQRVTAEVINNSHSPLRARFRSSGSKPWEKTISLEPGEKIALPS